MKEAGPGFAVIIPVYNGGAYIQRAIESCLQQTFLPDEIIVIDDASSDNTVDIIHSLSSPLIRYERNEKNSGPSFSRNRGMQLSSAQWILFLDADDIFHPQKIEIISYHVAQHTEIRAIGHSFDIICNNPFAITSGWKQLPLQKISVNNVLFKNPAVTPSLAVYSENRVLFNEAMVYAEDHDFILRTTEQFGMWYVGLPLCSLQRLPLTPGGISDNKWKMRKGEMSMYSDYCKRHKKYFAIPFLLAFSLLKHIKQMLTPA